MAKFKTLEEAQKAFDAQTKKEEKLTADLKAATELSATHKAEVDKLTKANEEAAKVVEELNGRLKASESNAPAEVTAKVGSKKYRINFGVRGKTKEEVAKDDKLVKSLVESGSAAVSEAD